MTIDYWLKWVSSILTTYSLRLRTGKYFFTKKKHFIAQFWHFSQRCGSQWRWDVTNIPVPGENLENEMPKSLIIQTNPISTHQRYLWYFSIINTISSWHPTQNNRVSSVLLTLFVTTAYCNVTWSFITPLDNPERREATRCHCGTECRW